MEIGLDRFTLTDYKAAETVGKSVVIGNAFVFFDAASFSKIPGYAWLRNLLEGDSKGTKKIVSLLGTDDVELPGCRINRLLLKELDLSSVTSDKRLYRAGRDVTNILVVRPDRPGTTQSLTVTLNGQEFAERTVSLGKHGEGLLMFRDLPVGQFKIKFSNAQSTQSDEERACTFEVAEYRLVPLVATVIQRQMTSTTELTVQLNIESFGTPVTGDVKIDLLENGLRRSTSVVTSTDGIATAKLHLAGTGAHELALQLVADANKTATVPLPGSRLSERSHTLFSSLGQEVFGSLMPESDAQVVRGIYLTQGGTNSSPINLEKVDTDMVRLKAKTAIDALLVVAIDPTAPRPAEGAIIPTEEIHPANFDPGYVRAEKLFIEGKHADALALFQESRRQPQHPNYAYFEACCFAKLGNADRAMEALQRAVRDGWSDFDHMGSDEDLSLVHNSSEFQALLKGGVQEYSYTNVQAGQVIEFPACGPTTVIAVGAYIKGKPWEGTACVVTPSKLSPEITLPETCQPGEEIIVNIKSGASTATTAYVVVKDARLLSLDNPATRLASALKSLAADVSEKIPAHLPELSLAKVAESIQPQTDWGASGSLGMTFGAAWEGATPTGAFPRMPMASPGGGWGGPPVGAASADVMSMVPGALPAPMAVGAEPVMRTAFAQQQPRGSAATATKAAPPVAKIMDDPEVAFAGFVQLENGAASVAVRLPDVSSQYLIECLLLGQLDWAYTETSFTAESDPAVELIVPTFAREGEPVLGTLMVKTKTKDATIKLLRDGKEVELLHNLKPFANQPITAGGALSLQFIASPGTYQAVIENGKTSLTKWKRVSPPGKLKHRVHAIRILQIGEAVRLKDDPSFVSLKALPGLESPFEMLIDATADYSHCCCEQTAAKILSGCALYMLGGGSANGSSTGVRGSGGGGSGGGSKEDDGKRRARAESIIIAGIRREQSMWLPGKGFKAYPEGAPVADNYVGPQAAAHLWSLDLLKTANGQATLSKELSAAVDEALKMARDATSAYQQQFPPTQIKDCADAYKVLRFSKDEHGKADALKFVQKLVKDKTAGEFASARGSHPYMGYQVHARYESAYAAASLLRSGNPQDITKALELANNVVKDFNSAGRLYSTVDSVAAIALMTELRAAKIVGDASVELNGIKQSLQEALQLKLPVDSLKVLDGTCLVEVIRDVQENWDDFAGGVQVRVAFEKDGQPRSSFTAGDAIDLKVTLSDGYKMGDLLWVCLPECVSRIVGGGQVKEFSIDFAGNNEVIIPLAATAATVDQNNQTYKQGVAVCVRNMFDEERAGSPGLIDVSVKQ